VGGFSLSDLYFLHWEDVGGHKMHIFTTNIPTFHSRYMDRCLLLTDPMSLLIFHFRNIG
jgi:hypothetical protein